MQYASAYSFRLYRLLRIGVAPSLYFRVNLLHSHQSNRLGSELRTCLGQTVYSFPANRARRRDFVLAEENKPDCSTCWASASGSSI